MFRTALTALPLLVILLAAGPARAADASYFVVTGEEFIDVLDAPGDGDFRGNVWDGMCAQGTGRTRADEDGDTWVEIRSRRSGWIRAENLKPADAICGPAFKTLEAIYETVKKPGFEPGEDCAGRQFIVRDVPALNQWFRDHAAPEIEFVRNTSSDELVSRTTPLDQALSSIADKFEFSGEFDKTCKTMTLDSVFDSMVISVGEKPGEFSYTLTDIADKSETFYFRNAQKDPQLYSVHSTYTYGR